MEKKSTNFFTRRLKAFVYAFKGLVILIRTEDSIKVHFFVTVIAIIMGFFFNINPTEWILQLLAIGLVIVTESLNTAIEKIADYINPNFHLKIGEIKDIAAGAVIFAALIAVIIGVIIYIPKIMMLIS